MNKNSHAKEHSHKKANGNKNNNALVIVSIILALAAVLALALVAPKINPEGKAVTTGSKVYMTPKGINPYSLSGYNLAEWDFDHLALVVTGLDYSGNNILLYPAIYGAGIGLPNKQVPAWVKESKATRNSLYFNATTDVPYLTYNETGLLQGLDQMSLSAWVKPTTNVGHRAIIRQWGNTNASRFEGILFMGLGEPTVNNNKLQFGVTDMAGKTFQIKTKTEVVLNDWTQVTVTWNGNTDQIKVYFNGIEQQYDIIGTTPHPTVTTNNRFFFMPVFIGGQYNNKTGTGTFEYMWRGYLDDIRIYSKALASSEVTGLMNQQDHMIYEYNKGSDAVVFPFRLDDEDKTMLSQFQQMSISAWITPTSTTGHRAIIRQWNGNNNTFYFGLGNATGSGSQNNQVWFGVKGYKGMVNAMTTTSIPLNQETVVTASWNVAGNMYNDKVGTIRIYFNGVLQPIIYTANTFLKNDSIYVTYEIPPYIITTPITVGGNVDGNYTFQGTIKRVRVYDKEIFKEIQTNVAENCNDGQDNNFNGLIDLADPACVSQAAQCASPKKITSPMYGVGTGAAIFDERQPISAGCCNADQCYDPKAQTADHCVASGTVVGSNKCDYKQLTAEYDPYKIYNAAWCENDPMIHNNGLAYCYNEGYVTWASQSTQAKSSESPKRCRSDLYGTEAYCGDAKKFICIDGICVEKVGNLCIGPSLETAQRSTKGVLVNWSNNGGETWMTIRSYCKGTTSENIRRSIINPYCTGIHSVGNGEGVGSYCGEKRYCIDYDQLTLGHYSSPTCAYRECVDPDGSGGYTTATTAKLFLGGNSEELIVENSAKDSCGPATWFPGGGMFGHAISGASTINEAMCYQTPVDYKPLWGDPTTYTNTHSCPSDKPICINGACTTGLW